MTKKLILQVDVKLEQKLDTPGLAKFKRYEDLYGISKHQAKKFAGKWGTDYLCIDNCDYLPDKHPAFQRFKMYDLDYDYILYLDCDAVVLDNCPDVFDLWKDHRFSACKDANWDKITTRREELRQERNSIYEASEKYRSFCSGVMMIRRDFIEETKHLWRDYINAYDKVGEHDQGIFNKLVILTGEDFNELSDDWGPWYRQGKYIDHLGAFRKRLNFDIKKYITKMNLVDFIDNTESEDSLSRFL